MPPKINHFNRISSKFRGMLPVVVDIETSGLNPATHAILEIGVVILNLSKENKFYAEKTFSYHVEPFVGANFDAESLAITNIDPSYPLRFAVPERQVLHTLFNAIDQAVKKASCQRAIIVGHNAWFDLAFLVAAKNRCRLSHFPFHSFTTLDTATLSAVNLGETVLARALRSARIYFDLEKAHSALYDAEKTAELFCYLMNRNRV